MGSLRSLLATVAAILLIGSVPAAAADYAAPSSAARREVPISYARVLPFPRSERTQAIWAEGSCWKQCQIACTSNLDLCLRSSVAPASVDQAQCIASADSCDRGCQYQCRSYGGPLLPPIPQ